MNEEWVFGKTTTFIKNNKVIKAKIEICNKIKGYTKVCVIAHEIGHVMFDIICEPSKTIKTYDAEYNAWEYSKVILKSAGFENWKDFQKLRKNSLGWYKRNIANGNIRKIR
jgi:hypothetical protein